MTRGSVLFVGPEDARKGALMKALPRKGFTVARCTTADETLRALEQAEPDVVVLDLHLPDGEGIAFCERIASTYRDLPVIIVTARGTLDTAIGSMRAGAYDYLSHPLRIEAVVIALDRAVQHRKLRREVRRLRQAVDETHRFEHLLGASPVMRELYDLLDRVASSDAAVLITGETGTGKEVVARTIHRRSRRWEGPFVAVNCAAMPESLLESELFGHVKGAFTDARAGRTGLFVQAAGGTIFLDEIGDMPLPLQPKLLRALQDRAVRPVGSNTEVPFDARVIAATNQDLERGVAEGRFRRDLYFRINVIQIDVPPLHARGSDVLLLAQHFLDVNATRTGKDVTRLSTEAARKLVEYRWPGNVRELENCIERAVALTREPEITPQDLPERIRNSPALPALDPPAEPGELVSMDVIEARYIQRVLGAVGGNKSTAARVLGFDRKTLYRKLSRYGIPVE